MRKLGILLMPLAWGAMHAQGVPPINYDTDMFLGAPSISFNMNDVGTTFREGVSGATFTAGGAGTTTFRQAGFNRLNAANYSELFAFNSKGVSPNFTLGDFEWSQAMTWTVHLRNLNVMRTNFTRSEIASKGPKGNNLQPSDLTSKGFDFFLHWTGTQTRPCILLSGSLVSGVSTGFTVCANLDLANGVDHDVLVRYDGAGVSGGFTWLVDNYPISSIVEQGGANFGTVSTVIGGSGTGYANSTPFTSTGGGSSCVVAGTMTSSGGVPASISYSSNSGCSSIPTLVLTAPTGTGVTLTVSLTGTSMSTSTTSPLTIAGNVSDSIANQGTNVHNAAGIQIDEYAMYPSAPGVTSPLGYQLFADAVGWQQFIALTSTPMLFIHDNDGCQDVDNYWAVDIAIRLHQRGQIRLLALNNTMTVTTDAQMYRSLLDRAGLGHVPMSMSSVSFTATSGNCANIANFSGSVRSLASYPADIATLRTALVNAPNGSVAYSLGGSYASLDALLNSPADAISPLTGTQLAVAKLSAVYIQVGYVGSTITSDNNINENFAAAQDAYTILNASAIPYYLTGGNGGSFGVPPTGPTRYSLSPTDPGGIWLNAFFTSTGGTQRTGWDSMTVLAPLLPAMFTNQAGTFVLAGTSVAWTGVFTTGAGTGNYQFVNSAASTNALGVVINSLTGSNPVPAPIHR